ncbi:hypothetical protein [Microbacterium sp. SLBN-146]|uniref:hypothetical protein n=1 Tax=Microbacterium sp. SLBN-146 TaxID=2768457 RepID=UPI00114E3DB7|nr:hypothetical protein [Microbacterium sp. SLBN-146]TQJ31302.1 hypothetical protein FBY39_1766 [Microbacterium sp. SLBN-146]
MESDQPSPSEARAILDGLTADGASLATRVVTPWWYHLTLGLVVATIVMSQTLPAPLSIGLVVAGIVSLPVITTTYTRRYGVSASSPVGPRTRRLLVTTLIVLAAGMVAALAIRATEQSAWWGLLPAGVVLFATIVLGRRYDAALRLELAGGGAKT